jgi:hypothetical protein
MHNEHIFSNSLDVMEAYIENEPKTSHLCHEFKKRYHFSTLITCFNLPLESFFVFSSDFVPIPSSSELKIVRAGNFA